MSSTTTPPNVADLEEALRVRLERSHAVRAEGAEEDVGRHCPDSLGAAEPGWAESTTRCPVTPG